MDILSELGGIDKRMLKGGSKDSPFTPYNKVKINDKISNDVVENLTSRMYNLNDYDVDKYAKYRVYVNPISTEKELNKERALNQSNLDQFGNFIVQAGLNEVAIGAIKGISDIIDAGINLGTNKGETDYTNPVSTTLENLQNSIRNEFAIYETEPDKAFNIGNFGWWMSNAVSMASTASMLIPGMGVIKIANIIGKLAKLEKVSRGIAKVVAKTGAITHTTKFAKKIDNFTKLAIGATTSRTIEGYMEARGVYNESLDNTKEKLSKMTNEDRDLMILNNPQLKGKTDDEVAKYIASVSADETFRNDYAMLTFDMIQLKAITSLWKGSPTRGIGGNLSREVRNASASLTQEGAASIKNLNFMQKLYDNAKYSIKHPFTSAGAIGWSEGLEEGYQGTMAEKGKEVGEEILNPSFRNRTLRDFVTDSSIWEQAFWGVLGGEGYQATGKGFGNLTRAVKGKINKNKLTDEEFAISQLTEEKIRANNIRSYRGNMQDYIDNMQIINNGKNPFSTINDAEGKPIVTNGNISYSDVSSEEEKEVLKDRLTEDFITNLTLNATDVGNYEILKAFVSDKNFNKFFSETSTKTGIDPNSISKEIIEKMDYVYESYAKALDAVLDNTEVSNENVLKFAARHISRNQFRLANVRGHIDEIQEAIDKADPNNTVNDNYMEWAKGEYAKQRLNELNIAKAINDAKLANGNINKITHTLANENIEKKRNSILEEISNTTGFGNIENVRNIIAQAAGSRQADAFINEFNKYFTNTVSKPNKRNMPNAKLRNLALSSIAYQSAAYELDNNIPKSEKDYKDLYDGVSAELDADVIKRYNAAALLINKYIENSPDIDLAMKNLLDKTVSPELSEAIDILKIANKTSNRLSILINTTVNIIKADRIKKEADKRNISVDGNPVSPATADRNLADVNSIIPDTIPNEVNTEESLPDHSPSQEELDKLTNVTPINNASTNNSTNDNAIANNEAIVNAPQSSDISTGDKANHIIPEGSEEGLLLREEVNNTIDAAQQIARDQAIRDESDFNLNADDSAAIFAQRVVIDLFRSSPNTFAEINAVDETDSNFNKILDYTIEEIIAKGVSPGIARRSALNGIKLAFTVRAIAMKNRNASETSKFKKLAAEIAVRSKIDTSGSMAAITSYLTDVELIDTVENFINAYIINKGLITTKNGKVYVDILDIFRELLDEDNAETYDKAKAIFNNLKAYVVANKSNKFVFINTKLLNKHISHPESFITELIKSKTKTSRMSSYMHISPSTKKNKVSKKIIKSIKNGDVVTMESSGGSIAIKKDGVEIGYIAKVVADVEANTFELEKQIKGFVYKIGKTIENTYTSNMDSFFSELIDRSSEDAKELFDLILQHKAYTSNNTSVSTNNSASWNIIKTNKLFKQLLEKGYFIFPDYINTESSKAKYFLDHVSNILLYNDAIITKDALTESYNDWKISIFDNYKNTYVIQNKLASSKNKINITIAGIDQGNAIRNATDRNVSELGFTGSANPIVGVIFNNIISESNVESYGNRAYMANGTMGYLIQDNPEAPIIATITEGNALNSNAQLSKNVNAELVSLFTDYANGKLAFNDLKTSLIDLIGSFGADHHNLFSGLSVIQDAGDSFIALSFQDKNNPNNGKYSIVINRYKKGTNEETISISHIKNGDTNNIVRINSATGNNIKAIDDMSKEIVSNLSFNRTFFSINNNNKKNTSNNKYIYKKDGKFIVDIGGTSTAYDNFSDFSIKNDAFKTNQGGSSSEGYFENTDAGSIYINVDTINSPVEGKQRKLDIKSPTDIIRSANKTTPVSARDVLSSAGFGKEYIDALLGENDFDVPISVKDIYYDESVTGAQAYFENGKLYITTIGSGKAAKFEPNNLVRLMVHESIHAHIASNKLFEGREHLIYDLLDTYNAFRDSLENNNDNDAIILKKWLVDNHLTPETYFNSLPEKERKRYNDATQTEKDKIFAEEWLAESLSQPFLIKYLNRTVYKTNSAVINNSVEKSLWQKIIDTLIKLFKVNGGNIKDNTILAQQYLILGNNNITTNKDNTNEIQTTINDKLADAGETTTPKSDEEITKENERLINEDSDIDHISKINKNNNKNNKRKRYAVTEIIKLDNETSTEIYDESYKFDTAINPTAIQSISSMNDFINQFDIKDRAMVASMVRNGEINFTCQ